MNSTLARPQVKSSRFIRMTRGPLQPGGSIYVEIKAGREIEEYRVSPWRSDFGDAFLLEQLDGILIMATYHVSLSDAGHTCDCDSGCRQESCIHTEGLAALRRAHKI